MIREQRLLTADGEDKPSEATNKEDTKTDDVVFGDLTIENVDNECEPEMNNVKAPEKNSITSSR